MLKICLVFWKSEPQYAYKLYAYKKNMYMVISTKPKQLNLLLEMYSSVVDSYELVLRKWCFRSRIQSKRSSFQRKSNHFNLKISKTLLKLVSYSYFMPTGVCCYINIFNSGTRSCLIHVSAVSLINKGPFKKYVTGLPPIFDPPPPLVTLCHRLP